MDIANSLNNYGVNLEQKAVNQFGAAAQDFANMQKLGVNQIDRNQIADYSLSGASSTPQYQASTGSPNKSRVVPDVGSSNGTWQSSMYASDLVSFAPKHRFIFKVKFVFNEPYSRINREFMYLVKEIDKPTVTFEYEDINMYNFKTKVLKSIRHEPLNMAFHDDIQNKVLDFFNAYRLAYSPVSSLSPDQKIMFEETGMDFYEPSEFGGGVNSASMGLLANGQVNVLSHIELVQIYGHGTRQTIFKFTNPRIEQFDFDNLSHESADNGSALTVSFNYDALLVQDGETTGTPEYSWGKTDILGNSESAPRSQFGNQMMGSDSTGKRSAVGGFDSTGISISPNISAFPISTRDVTSSGWSELDNTQSTISSAIPKINQATAGFNLSNFVSSALTSQVNKYTKTYTQTSDEAFLKSLYK